MMIKDLKFASTCLAMSITLVFGSVSAMGQAKISLQNTKTEKPEADKPAKPVQTNGPNAPLLMVLPDPKSGPSAAEAPRQSKTGTTQTATEAPSPATQCNFTLLMVNEFFQTFLVNSGIPCLGCTIPEELSQSTSGVLGFSKNPNGPWTDTLTVNAFINFQGNGNSEPFYIKGLTVGTTVLHMHNFWADNFYEFEVQNCACPTIPVVP
jgi:hypothetical protein